MNDISYMYPYKHKLGIAVLSTVHTQTRKVRVRWGINKGERNGVAQPRLL